MSPGVTFERVYRELKRMLLEGELLPGAAIEPAIICSQIASSITPVRDALHRRTGERLVEAPNHNGFRVPLLSEAALRDLYGLNGIFLELAVKQNSIAHDRQDLAESSITRNIAVSTAALFLEIAKSTGSIEIANTIASLNDRLATFRLAESAALGSVPGEFSDLLRIASSGDRTALLGTLKRYHRRRIAAAADIVARVTASQAR